MRKSGYLLRRGIQAIVTCFVAVTLNFILFRQLPGTVVSNLSRVPDATPALQLALTRSSVSTTRPGAVRSLPLAAVHLNLGFSYQIPNRSWKPDLRAGQHNSDGHAGHVFSIVFGVLTGVIAAWRRGTKSSTWPSPRAGFYAMPVQWLGLMLIVLFASFLPTSGMRTSS